MNKCDKTYRVLRRMPGTNGNHLVNASLKLDHQIQVKQKHLKPSNQYLLPEGEKQTKCSRKILFEKALMHAWLNKTSKVSTFTLLITFQERQRKGYKELKQILGSTHSKLLTLHQPSYSIEYP